MGRHSAPPEDGGFAARASAITQAVVRRHTGAIPLQHPGSAVDGGPDRPTPAGAAGPGAVGIRTGGAPARRPEPRSGALPPPLGTGPASADLEDGVDDGIDDLGPPPFAPVVAGSASSLDAEPATIEDLPRSSAALVGIPLMPERPSDRRLRRLGVAFGALVVVAVAAALVVAFLPGAASALGLVPR